MRAPRLLEASHDPLVPETLRGASASHCLWRKTLVSGSTRISKLSGESSQWQRVASDLQWGTARYIPVADRLPSLPVLEAAAAVVHPASELNPTLAPHVESSPLSLRPFLFFISATSSLLPLSPRSFQAERDAALSAARDSCVDVCSSLNTELLDACHDGGCGQHRGDGPSKPSACPFPCGGSRLDSGVDGSESAMHLESGSVEESNSAEL